MVIYTCEICGYSTHLLKNYQRHLNRKNPCKPKTENVSQKKVNPSASLLNPYESLLNPSASLISKPPSPTPCETISCIYCGKSFTMRTNLTRHMNKSCKIIKNQISNTDADELKKKNKELEEKIDKLTVQLINKPSVVYNTNKIVNKNDNSITTHTSNEIILTSVSYFDERLHKLSPL